MNLSSDARLSSDSELPPASKIQQLRAGVVGTGAFGRHHAGKYASAEGVVLSGIADLSAAVRADMEERFATATYENWQDLVGTVDLVSICSPAVTHAEIVGAFLDAGTHVLVEKPIATTLEEADALIALAEKRNVVLTVGHQERFVFARSGLMDMAQTPLEISSWRMGPWTARGDDVSAVLDLMIHDIDLVHRLVPGAVADVETFARAERSRFADEVSTTVAFENGTVARLHASRVAQQRKRGMQLVYVDGVVEIDFLTREIRNTTRRPLGKIAFDDPLSASVASFIASVRGAPVFVRPEEARLALQTALTIEQAALLPARHPLAEKFAASA
ncbi:MAG TPA: Gfo/Idh/MocA family oxidoreductase [Rhizomicrobium sp.]|nr:Gfo/Idh/MocA family oxidoreductase [Rhizomicrobium sp.]